MVVSLPEKAPPPCAPQPPEKSVDECEKKNIDLKNISLEDIQAKLNELQAIEDAKQYQRDRKSEYPSIEDCVHALLDGGDTLTDLQALRQAVKDKYPKE